VVAIKAFVPPAIEHAEINSAVRRAFHSAGAARFHRPERIVQPKIDTLHESARDVAVVVLEKHGPVLKSGFAAEFVNFLDQRAPTFIARMRFAGKDELHRARGVVEQSPETFFIAEQERTAFVSSES